MADPVLNISVHRSAHEYWFLTKLILQQITITNCHSIHPPNLAFRNPKKQKHENKRIIIQSVLANGIVLGFNYLLFLRRWG